MSRTIMICFVRSDSAVLQASWLNSIASMVAPNSDRTGPPYIHVELLFPPKHGTNKKEIYGEACSIVYGGAVHLSKKRFSRKEWEFRSMTCTDSQYKTMKTFCQDHIGESFNHVGYFMYWAGMFAPKPLFYTYFGMKPRWYCSELVIGALKSAGILGENHVSAQHPDSLYHVIKKRTMMDCGRNMHEIDLQFV